MIEPQTEIRIIKSPIELDNLNQLTFSNATAQENYFKSLPYLEMDDSSYQRKDNVIRFDGAFDEAIKYNYCMYKNDGYTNKWFYAFITNVEYLNDETSLLTIKTDVFQTWQFDITYKESFIEREMLSLSDDIIGANTIPENLELGDYVIADNVIESNIGATSYICIGVSEDIYNLNLGTHIYNGIASGLTYLIVENSNALDYILTDYAQAGKINEIITIFMIPSEFNSSPTWITLPNSQLRYAYIPENANAYVLTGVSITKPTKLGNNYIPKNKKLFTYPFSYLLASNNAGSDVIYKYEYFKFINETGFGFQIYGAVSPGCSIKYIPTYYKNSNEKNYEESFNAGKYPIGSWTNDTYTNWLTQQGLNIPLSVASNIMQILGGGFLATTGGGGIAGAGSIASGIMGIANTISQVYEHSLAPYQCEGNINSSDIIFALHKSGAMFYKMSINDNFAEIIDSYFSMFGYKTNKVKLPNLNNRTNWNYVKTINCNLLGDIPQSDMQELKQLFNNGITLWHNPNTFLDYAQINN